MSDDLIRKVGDGRWLVLKRCRITGVSVAHGPTVEPVDDAAILEEGTAIEIRSSRKPGDHPASAEYLSVVTEKK